MIRLLSDVISPVLFYPIIYWPLTLAGLALVVAAIILFFFLKKKKQKDTVSKSKDEE